MAGLLSPENQSWVSHVDTAWVIGSEEDLWTNTTDAPSSSGGCRIFGFWVTYSLVMVAMQASGIVGNMLSFAIMWKDRNKRGTSLLLIVLAVIDTIILVLLFLLATIPALCLSLSDCSYYLVIHNAYVFCYAAPLFTTFHLSTTLITLQVTVHRYILVCMPHRSNTLGTIRVVRAQTVVSLVVAILFTLPRYFAQQIIYPEGNEIPKRVPTKLGASLGYKLYYNIVAYYVVFYMIPLSILLVLTTRLHRAIMSARARRMEMTSSLRTGATSGDKVRHDDSVTVTLVAVVVVFMVCQIPNPIRRTLNAYLSAPRKDCGTAYFYVHRLVHFALSLNSAINFVLYCVFGKQFRRRLVAMVLKRGIVVPAENIGVPDRTFPLRTTQTHPNVTLQPMAT